MLAKTLLDEEIPSSDKTLHHLSEGVSRVALNLTIEAGEKFGYTHTWQYPITPGKPGALDAILAELIEERRLLPEEIWEIEEKEEIRTQNHSKWEQAQESNPTLQ